MKQEIAAKEREEREALESRNASEPWSIETADRVKKEKEKTKKNIDEVK